MGAPLWKPVSRKFELAKVKRERAKAKARETQAQKRRELAAMSVLRHCVYLRDLGRCRACCDRLKEHSANDFDEAHLHHIVYRSAGGANTTENTCILCPQCHDLEHRHVLIVRGNGDGLLLIARRNLETGRIEHEWESPNPTAQEVA